jgi:asparagine synthase (glutamine-hydrolysing)
MSGFAGWVALGVTSPQPSPESLKDLFAQALDSPGLSAARALQGEGATFVHRQRISAPEDIGDLQPRQGREAPFVLLFDGYLINREDLIAALGLPAEAGHWPDSALALAALEAWGDDAPARLLGDFALALWNSRERSLLLARDAIGQRPLYYHHGQGFLAFATTPRALLALPQVPRAVNEGRFARLLLDLPSDREDSFFAAIRSLPAGCQAKLAGDHLESRCYWEPDYDRRLTLKHDDDYVEAGRELLDRAVRACLRIEGPPVAAITGGLDSSGVAVTALKYLPGGELTTVTAVSSAPTVPDTDISYSDERPLVEAIARQHPGLKPVFLSGSDPHRWDERWAEMFLLAGMPWRNVMNLAWLGPTRDYARERGAKVLLSAGLGNLTLSWDGREALPGALRSGRWGYLGREVAALATNGVSLPRQFWRSALAPLLPFGRRRDQALRQSPIRPEVADALGLVSEADALHRRLTGSSADIRRAFFPTRQQATEAAGLGRALHGLEIRDPLADRRLLEFCFAVPDDQYLRGGVTRRLARRVLADRSPPAVIDNRRRGFQSADFFYRMSQQKDVIADGIESLSGSALATRFLDLPRLKSLLDAWPADGTSAGLEYLAVLHRGLHYGQFLRWTEGGNS